jgi:hypothetical protein
MTTILLVTRPKHDLTTRYLSAWAQKVIDEANTRGNTVLDLHGSRARRELVEAMAVKQRPKLIFFNGHGSEDCVCGHDDEKLVAVGDNEAILAGAVVYALSCQSARVLGVQSVANGARTYIGYRDDFIFLLTIAKQTRPADDRLAALFFNPSNQVVLSLLKGHNAHEAYSKAKRDYARAIRKLLTSETNRDDTATVRYLYWNMRHLVYHGDGSAAV